MKKLLPLFFFFLSFNTNGQILKRADIKVSFSGADVSVLAFRVFDVSAYPEAPAEGKPKKVNAKKYPPLDDATIVVQSPMVREVVQDGFTTTDFQSAKLTITVSCPGYKTLKERYKRTESCEYLDVFLTPEKQ